MSDHGEGGRRTEAHPDEDQPPISLTPRWTVVVVDDDPDVLDVVKSALVATTAWRVLVAPSAAAARTILAAVEADVLLVDEHMPGEGGTELVASLYETRALGRTTAILLTAGRRGAPPRSVAGVIDKPFDPLTLATRIAVMVAERKTKRG